MWSRLKSLTMRLKRDVLALWLAAHDPRVSWYAKAMAGAVAAYALSPIDLIPDVIPVLGYLDDLLILPWAIWLSLRLVPTPLIAELRLKAAQLAERPISYSGAAAVVTLWLLVAGGLIWLFLAVK